MELHTPHQQSSENHVLIDGLCQIDKLENLKQEDSTDKL
jgi:hypothetical protein